MNIYAYMIEHCMVTGNARYSFHNFSNTISSNPWSYLSYHPTVL